MDLALGASGPALVGERFLVPIAIAFRDHAIYASKMKINLVDVRGGGLFSPREAEPFSLDSHHVELLGIVGPEGEDDHDKIKKIQQSFGLVSVPFLNIGESWSCKLEIVYNFYSSSRCGTECEESSTEVDSTTPKLLFHR